MPAPLVAAWKISWLVLQAEARQVAEQVVACWPARSGWRSISGRACRPHRRALWADRGHVERARAAGGKAGRREGGKAGRRAGGRAGGRADDNGAAVRAAGTTARIARRFA